MAYVCAAPRDIYDPLNMPEELRHLSADTLSVDPHDYGITFEEILFAAGRYRWPSPLGMFVSPDEFTERLTGFYSTISDKVYPASALVSIHEAVVSRNVVYCKNGSERRILYETLRPNDRAAIDLTPDAELDAPDIAFFSDPTWNYLYLGSAGSSNYGHWLVDDLPRVKAASSLLLDKKPLRIIIPGYASSVDQVRMDSIRTVLRSPVHIDLINPRKPYYFPRLFYATPVSDHPISKSPLAMDFAARETLSSVFADENVKNDGRNHKLYVARSQARGRNLLNEDCLLPMLTKLGYIYVDTDAMSFAKQVSVFSQASIVVGTMGAAMANTLFCRPHTQILHLAPRGWIEPFYLDLASVRAHQYQVLYGDVANPEIPAHLSDFTIPADIFATAI